MAFSSSILDIKVDRRVMNTGFSQEVKRRYNIEAQESTKSLRGARRDGTLEDVGLWVLREFMVTKKHILKKYKKAVRKHLPPRVSEKGELIVSVIKNGDLTTPQGTQKVMKESLEILGLGGCCEVLPGKQWIFGE